MRQEAQGETLEGQLLDFVSPVVKWFSICVSLCHHFCDPLNLTCEQLEEPAREVLRVAKPWDAYLSRWIDKKNEPSEGGNR